MEGTSLQKGYNGRVFCILVLVFADLVINGVADFDPLPNAEWYLPIIWVACVAAARLFLPRRRPPAPNRFPLFHTRLPAAARRVHYGIQLLILIMIFMLFSSAYLFQVGLVWLQVREFRPLLLGMLAYALIYAAYAAVKLVRCSAAARARKGARPSLAPP
jgi:hypothetical protein